MDTNTKIPTGNEEFMCTFEEFRSTPITSNNKFELAAKCCRICPKNIDCEECFVQTVGDLKDPYRKEIEQRSATGMYSSGIFVDKDGKYHYSHPQGSG